MLVWAFCCCLLELLFWLLYYSCPQCAFLSAAVVVFMLLFAMAGAQWRTASTDCACVVEVQR